MVAASNFIFKGMKKREAGKFTTKEGKEVQYDENLMKSKMMQKYLKGK